MTTMAKPLSQAERDEIARLLDAGKSRQQITQATGRGAGTIDRVAKSIGWRSDQSGRLARAHEARSAYSAERRAAVAVRATGRLEELLVERMSESRQEMVVTKEGAELVELRPDARSWRDWSQAVHLLTKSILDIDRHDNRGEDLSAVDSWLRSITGGAG